MKLTRCRNLIMALLVMGVILGMNTASAFDITADPNPIEVQKGGYRATNLEVTVDQTGDHQVGFEVATDSQDCIDAKLTGPNGANTGDFDDDGVLTLVDADADKTYSYTLNVSATSDASTEETYDITVYATEPNDNDNLCGVTTDVVDVDPVPELVTGALIGIGIVAVGAARKLR